MTRPVVDHAFVDDQVAQFQAKRPLYAFFAQLLHEILSQAVRDLGLMAVVETRAKAIPSFAEKVVRKQDKYKDPIHQFDDLCGARVVVSYPDEVGLMSDFIRRHFEVDPKNSEDVFERLGVSEFGYRSVHFTVAMKPGEFISILERRRQGWAYPGDVCSLLLERYQGNPGTVGLPPVPPGPAIRAEIQVRTLLQHAWAVFAHDRLYKSDFDIPKHFGREAGRLAATLETADDAFARTVRGLEVYRNYFGPYKTHEERLIEIERLSVVLKNDPQNVRLAHGIARLAGSLRDWDLVLQTLEPFVRQWQASEDFDRFEVLRKEISTDAHGRSVDRYSIEETQKRLLAFRDPLLSQVMLEYGRAKYEKSAQGMSCENLGAMAELDRSSHLDAGNADAPLALADICFRERRYHKALEHYQQAQRLSPSDPMVLTGLIRSKIFLDRNLDFVPLIRQSLETGIRVCRDRIQVGVYLPWAYADIGFFSLLLERPYESLFTYLKAIAMAGDEMILKHLRESFLQTHTELEAKIPSGKEDAFQWVQSIFDLASRAFTDSSSRGTSELRPLMDPQAIQSLPRPLVMVAGGCDESIAAALQDYRSLLETAFKGFEGTVFCGGTTAGISGMVGDLPTGGSGRFRKIAYLPMLPPWTRPHEAYEPHFTRGHGFSPLEPIQNWTDLLAAGVPPSEIRLLGINGGNISAFEFRLAITLGVKVGIIAESGRAAAEILEDPDWRDAPGLMRLPNDPQTVRAFVQRQMPPEVITEEDRRNLARDAHNSYVRNRKAKPTETDSALLVWDELPEDFRQSNIQQIEHIEIKLKAVGLKLRKISPDEVQLLEFTDLEREKMAEMEHGRFVTERLLAGWKYGTERDPVKKTSPTLIPWAILSEEEKKKDREAVDFLPGKLKEYGYEISRPQKK